MPMHGVELSLGLGVVVVYMSVSIAIPIGADNLITPVRLGDQV